MKTNITDDYDENDYDECQHQRSKSMLSIDDFEMRLVVSSQRSRKINNATSPSYPSYHKDFKNRNQNNNRERNALYLMVLESINVKNLINYYYFRFHHSILNAIPNDDYIPKQFEENNHNQSDRSQFFENHHHHRNDYDDIEQQLDPKRIRPNITTSSFQFVRLSDNLIETELLNYRIYYREFFSLKISKDNYHLLESLSLSSLSLIKKQKFECSSSPSTESISMKELNHIKINLVNTEICHPQKLSSFDTLGNIRNNANRDQDQLTKSNEIQSVCRFHNEMMSRTQSNSTRSCYCYFFILFLISLLSIRPSQCNTRSHPVFSINSDNNGSAATGPDNTTTVYSLSDLNEVIKKSAFNNPHFFCGAPPLVPNAQSDLLRQQKHFVFQVGSEAEYLCEYGYRAVNGTSKTRCIIDGINIDTAHHVLFEALNSDQNSRITSDRSKYSKVMLHHDDEEPEPNSSIQRSPNDLFNRKKSSRKNDDDLYEIEGQPNAKKIQAHWYPPITLDCQLVYCPDPGQVKHARRNDPKINPFAYNTNVHYACEEGYETIGVPFLTCRQDGTWNRQPPECRLKQCPLITEPKNGWIKYSDNNRPTHSRAEYYCNQGYRLNALSNTRHCGSNNSWTLLEQTPLIFISPSIDSKARNDSYECLPVTCPTPSKPHNGLRIVDVNRKQRQNRQNFIPGDIIIYNCISNKIRATARCNSDGEWSRGMPHCPIDETINSLKCKPFDSFTHGSVKYVENAAVFSCKDGFELEGKSTINCNPNGVWNGPLPRCVLKMAAPPELVPTTSNTISSISDTVITNESIDDQEPKISKTLMILLILISIVLFVLIVVATVSFYHWRQRRLNSKTWQRYFGHYYHRQSKTNIMLSTQFGANMHHNHNHHQNHTVNGVQNATIGSTASSIGSTSNTTTTARLLPRTGKLSRQKSAGYQLQSSFSSGDENNSDMKSFTTDQTITSERARTISTYVDDTCAEYEDEEEDEFVEEDEDDDQDEDGASIFRHPSIPIAIAAKKNNSLPLDILSSSINDQNYMDSFGDHSNLGEDASIMNSTRQGYNPAKRALSSGNAHQLNGNYHQQSSSSQSKPTSIPLAANNEMTLLTLNSTSSQNGNNFVIPVTDL